MLKGDRKFQHRMNCVAGFLLLFCFYALLFWHLSTGLCCFRVYNDSIVYSMDIYICQEYFTAWKDVFMIISDDLWMIIGLQLLNTGFQIENKPWIVTEYVDWCLFLSVFDNFQLILSSLSFRLNALAHLVDPKQISPFYFP